MLKTLGLTGLILATLTAPALAQSRYDLDPAKCGVDSSDSSLRLTKDSFEFYEASCRVVTHTIVSQTASDLTLDCSGEGESWTRQLLVEVTKTGLRLTDDSGTYDYAGCN